MANTLMRGLAPAMLCAAVLVAQAQTPAQTDAQTHAQTPPSTPAATAMPTALPGARPDPLNARASVPAPVYRSSLAPARRADAEKPVTWREANDTVTRIGGWRTYAREAQAPEVAPAAAAPTPATPSLLPEAAAKPPVKPTPVPAGHSGHKAP